MDENNNVDNFDRMLAIADFAEKSHNDRRQIEFRITISYITLLVLALYQVTKPSTNGIDFVFPWWIIVTACFLLIATHFCYIWWQRTFHIASNNDVRRRDFYLKKTELIAYYMSQDPDSKVIGSSTETVTLNLGAGDSSDPITEYEFLKEKMPDIYINKNNGTHLREWYKNVYFLLPFVGSTSLLFLLIATLIIKKVNC